MIQVEGLRELHLAIERKAEETISAGRKGLRAAGMNIIADAKNNLRGNHSVVTGQLRAMGKVQKVEDDPDAIDAGFFARGSSQGYAYFVEYGRRATKTTTAGVPTLRQAIEQWLRKKFGMAEGKDLKSRSFLISRAIHKKGTKPHPFFAPAVEKNRAAIENAVSESVKEIL